MTVGGCSSGAETSAVVGVGEGRGWGGEETVEARVGGGGSASREDGAALSWGQLRVRILTGEDGKPLGDSWDREKTRDIAFTFTQTTCIY